jgi:hypothetical protein
MHSGGSPVSLGNLSAKKRYMIAIEFLKAGDGDHFQKSLHDDPLSSGE